LAREVEDEIGRGEEAGRVAGEDRLVDEILGDHGLAEAVRGDDDPVLAVRENVEREDAVDGRAMDGLGPLPFPIGHRLEASETRVPEPAFDAVPQPGVEFGLGESFELHDGTPALLRGAGDEVIELASGVDEPELLKLITQRRWNRIE
jgi:hypothetical protein